MSTAITLPEASDRAGLFTALLPQLEALIADEQDMIANMANVAAVLHTAFAWHWVGFYRVDGNTLVLGPFQGPVACTRIPYGKGVCGTAWSSGRTIVVPDVDQFPGHIACSALSRSEVVVPIHDKKGKVIAVLDVDSSELNDFSESDVSWLEGVCELLASAQG
jgi:GAF domain-containing protein